MTKISLKIIRIYGTQMKEVFVSVLASRFSLFVFDRFVFLSRQC